jgi:urate oxidase
MQSAYRGKINQIMGKRQLTGFKSKVLRKIQVQTAFNGALKAIAG